MLDGYVESVCAFAEYRDVYLLRPIPELEVSVPRTMGRKLMYTGSLESVSIPLDEYLSRNKEVMDAQNRARELCGVKILEVQPYLCDDIMCRGDKDGVPVYYDDDHLNNIGSELFLDEFKKMFNKVNI